MTKKTILIIVLILVLFAVGFGFYRAQQSNNNTPLYVSVTVLGNAEEHEGTARAINSVQLYYGFIRQPLGAAEKPVLSSFALESRRVRYRATEQLLQIGFRLVAVALDVNQV